ncbi:hypothetical protein NQ176_g10060 [Zarea fungicola]|uniref:Uncharacterized protein n=1 Tax=Zarea fungicola TaxID=93591 RepID=A0ACC1MK27_9HYPO|nr:hypothetical protein NQ176_g10060 [Lecanicillium fungicola]
MGMDAAPAMEDHHSFSLMPWSRQGSAVPGSSIRAPPSGSAQKTNHEHQQQQSATSPLLHRSTGLIAGFDRHSDPIAPPTPSRGVAEPVSSFDSSMDVDPVLDFTDAAYADLDVPSQEFLEYASKRAVAHGRPGTVVVPSPSGNETSEIGRRWIDFEHIANSLKHDSAIAAHAFMHVLSLATRGVINVHQENNRNYTEPFGTIYVGINLSPGAGNEDY